MLHQAGSALGRFGALLLVAVLAGSLLAAIVLPVVGGTGLAARTASDDFINLPTTLPNDPLPTRSTILAADGSVLASYYYQDRLVVPISKISPLMQHAIVAIEDSRFYEHSGIDLRGAMRALVTNSQSGGVQEGASTLTMQLVRNLLVSSADTEGAKQAALDRTLARKIREMRYALGMEEKYSKAQILEAYLNIAYFGAGAYGVEAAARRYFSTSAAQLTLPQAATLAGIVQQPVRFDPLSNPTSSERRRNTVLSRMADLKYITAAQATAAQAVPMSKTLKPREVANGCSTSFAPFYCDYVIQQLLASPALGATRAAREAVLRSGGLTIRTTLDPKIQKGAQAAVNAGINPTDPSGKATAIAMVEPGTGLIRALAENRIWGVSGPGRTTVNFAVDQASGGSLGMQAGSTFKVFTLAAAISKGFSLATQILSPQTKAFDGFTNCAGQPVTGFSPANSTGAGTFDMRSATALSINTYFVELEKRVGLCDVVTTAEKMGVRTALGQDLPQVASFTLGTADVSPLTMANAYATVAAHGKYCPPTAIMEVRTRGGQSLNLGKTACTQALDPQVADAVTYLLAGVIDGPVQGRTGQPMSLGRPAAGKTGTTDGNAAVWFAGFTPQLAAAVWAGDPRGGPSHPMQNITINGQYYQQVYGRDIPGPIWKSAMLTALKGQPALPFTPPDPSAIQGLQVSVPDLVGKTYEQALNILGKLGLTGEQAPGKAGIADSALPGGQVVSSNPKAGSNVGTGGSVLLTLSSGKPPKPTESPSPSGSPSGSPSSTGSPSGTPSSPPSTSPTDKPTGKPTGKPSGKPSPASTGT